MLSRPPAPVSTFALLVAAGLFPGCTILARASGGVSSSYDGTRPLGSAAFGLGILDHAYEVTRVELAPDHVALMEGIEASWDLEDRTVYSSPAPALAAGEAEGGPTRPKRLYRVNYGMRTRLEAGAFFRQATRSHTAAYGIAPSFWWRPWEAGLRIFFEPELMIRAPLDADGMRPYVGLTLGADVGFGGPDIVGYKPN